MKQSYETLPAILGLDVVSTDFVSQDLFSTTVDSEVPRHEVYRASVKSEFSLPVALVPAFDDVNNLFATVATYYPDYCPLSSMVHVYAGGTSHLLSCLRKKRKTSLLNKGEVMRKAFIGASVGEAVLASMNSPETGKPSYAACRRTLSYSLCRAALLYGKEIKADMIISRWERLRAVSGLAFSTSVGSTLELMYNLIGTEQFQYEVGPQFDSGYPIWSKLSKYVFGEIDGWQINDMLSELYPGVGRYLNDLSGAFDSRMTAFTKFLDVVKDNTQGTYIDEVSVAFACNAILPGSFAHSRVLLDYLSPFPSSLLWYGLFVAVSKSEVLSGVNLGLIMKLDRDLSEEFSIEHRPRCDISLEELEVLSSSPLNSDIVKPTQQRAVLVSLLPGVDIYTRFGLDSEFTRGAQGHSDMETLHKSVSKLLEEALSKLQNSTHLENKVIKNNSRRRKDW